MADQIAPGAPLVAVPPPLGAQHDIISLEQFAADLRPHERSRLLVSLTDRSSRSREGWAEALKRAFAERI